MTSKTPLEVGGPPSNNAATSWRVPPLAKQQKYNLKPLPEDFEPTQEEAALLAFYETVQNFERQASKIKEEAARARLAARDAEFKEKEAERKRLKELKRAERRKKKKEAQAKASTGMAVDEDGSDEESSSEEESDSDASSNSDSTDDKHAAREDRLQELREEIEEAKQKTAFDAEDALREELLTTNAIDDDGQTLKRKRFDDDDYENKTSLIANLNQSATPPHDFSKKLELNAVYGRVLFPTIEEETSWEPPADARSPFDGAFTVDLEDFDVEEAQNGSGNNTLGVKFMAPANSKRFSLNIAAPDHDGFDSILFHFNPRQQRGGQLVLNNKVEGTWGQAVNVPLSQLPMIFGQQSCTLIIQINGDGFDVFINDKHAARLEHRRELPSGKFPLVLNFPGTDDSNKRENWSVYKVWWGNKAIMSKSDLSGVPGYNSYSSTHPRKLFISGLRRIRAEAEIDLRRAELERAFRKYGGARGVQVIVPKNVTFAFVEMESERQADLALQEMQNEYPRINRARRSKHEALQEERAAKDLAGKGRIFGRKETTDWD